MKLDSIVSVRCLVDGTEVIELKNSMAFKIKTKCPDKWILIDLESQRIMTPDMNPNNMDWKSADGIDIELARKVIDNEQTN